MQIRVLGHVEASVDDRPLSLGGSKQRAVLAMLALDANRSVSADRLIDGLWGDDAPHSAPKMVQNYIWRLRRILDEDGGAEIVTHGRGYELRIDPDAVDVRRLERLVSEAGRAAEAGRPPDAARDAVALFRGEPLADLSVEPFAAAEIRRLEDLRMTATELAIDADLAAGRHREMVGRIETLLAQAPLRERLHAQRMLALYRCGRQAEALEAFRDARSTLVDEVGIEPGPELRGLHDAILRQDPSLDVLPAPAEFPAELDIATAPPVTGREGELRRLRTSWQRAAGGTGALVTVVGAYGMGKTRLAAELAADVHRDGATVLYATGTGAPEAALAAITRTRDAKRPALLVLDDADRAPRDVHAALAELARVVDSLPALVLATGVQPAALDRLAPRDRVVLAPLDAEAVRLVAGFYAPAGGSEAPVEALLATSDGVARRVHQAASEWARQEATRRVDDVAGRAAAGRSRARALEAELAGTVVDLQSARERARLASGGGRDAGRPAVCPYKGLASFHLADAEYFFGREQLVAELVARLVGAPLLGVVGPSGSGKSSVLRAGLMHAIAGGVLPGSDGWARVVMRPGEHPMGELRRACSGLGEQRAVIAVDQFEELFTACRDEEERREFVAALVRATDDRNSVVLALRADFYGRCAAYPDLARLLAANQALVGQMARDELRRAIERPAQRAGLSVEPELVDELLSDVEGRPGGLPLMSTALLQLWRDRDGQRLRAAAYARSGGVQGAVARLAEDAFLRLDASQQAAARKVLLRLADDGERGATVRRRVDLAELQAFEDVVARLTESRLLTTSDGSVEVAHEALLREWPRLRHWLAEDVEGRRLHRQLGDAAHAWDEAGRDPGDLYRGARLTAALEWRAGHEDELSATERAFLDAGRAAGERAHRRLRIALAGVSLLLVAAVVAGLVALDQRRGARTEARTAQAQRLGAQALSEEALDRSLLLARQGVALDDSLATRSNLLAALLRSPAALRVMRGDGGRMLAVAVHPSGRRIIAGDNQGSLAVFDEGGRRLAGGFRTGLPVQAIRFSPDGTRVAVASGHEGVGAFDLLDAVTLRRIAHRRLGWSGEPFRILAFSPDSRVVATSFAPWNEDESRPGRGLLERWDARTGRRLGQPVALTREGDFLVSFISAGRVVTMREDERELVVRDAATGRPIRRVHASGVHWVSAVSRDGHFAALGRDDGSVQLVDLLTGRARTASGRHDAPVQGAAFTADGRTLVTAGDDAKVMVWDVAAATATAAFEGHAGRVTSVAVSPDGRTAYTASLDGTVIAWDLSGSRRFGRLFAATPRHGVRTISETGVAPEGGGAYNLSVSPRGDMLAVAQWEGFINLHDSRGRPIGRFHAVEREPAGYAAFAPDGRTLAVTGGDGSLGFWDARTRTRLAPPVRVSQTAVWRSQFSADGRWLAFSGQDSVVRLWDGRRHAPVRTRRLDQLPRDLALRPDGKVLVVPATWGPGQGYVDVLSVPSLERVARIAMTNGRWSSFSRDGRLLILGDHEGRAQIYDGRTFKPRGRPLLGHAGYVLTADFSPDARMVATSSSDGTVRLWDTASSRLIGRPLPAIPNVQTGAAFIGGGSRLVAVSDNGQGFLWDIRPSAWMRRACAVAGRTLTRAEWDDALPGSEYRPACGPKDEEGS
jgi:WD40 repeat protein/DNA-binding SARP family transcriptional activator